MAKIFQSHLNQDFIPFLDLKNIQNIKTLLDTEF